MASTWPKRVVAGFGIALFATLGIGQAVGAPEPPDPPAAVAPPPDAQQSNIRPSAVQEPRRLTVRAVAADATIPPSTFEGYAVSVSPSADARIELGDDGSVEFPAPEAAIESVCISAPPEWQAKSPARPADQPAEANTFCVDSPTEDTVTFTLEKDGT